MEIRPARTCFAVASFFLILGGSSCGSSNSNSSPPTVADAGPPTATELGNQYKFSPTDLNGWQLDPNDPANFQVLQEGTPTDLYSFMDGGSDLYTNNGCTITIYESLIATYPKTATFYAMYFGTATNATTMFNDQKTTFAASGSIPGFDASVAIGYPGLASETVFAHFGAMYIELVVSGFGSDTASAYQTAAQILTVLKSKTH
ncbi:MAG: hypothetical protein WCG85_15695 [Polyangia bacterium]